MIMLSLKLQIVIILQIKVRRFGAAYKVMKKYLRSAHEPPASFAGGPSPLTLHSLHQVKIIRDLCAIGGASNLENLSVFDVGCGYGTFLMTAWCSGCNNIAGLDMGSHHALSDSLHSLITVMKNNFHELPRLNMQIGLDRSNRFGGPVLRSRIDITHNQSPHSILLLGKL